MAGMGGIGAGLGIMGGTLGGIGDIISGLNYQRPKLKPATGMELRLRQLAQNQLLGGGQQLLGATALYNQLAPILLGQLPGMHYVPPSGDSSAGGGATGGGTQTSGNAGDYTGALANQQQRLHQQQQLEQLQAQMKGMQAGPQRKALRGQIKQQKQLLKSQPPMNQLDRAAYMAGTQPGSFDIRQGPPAPLAPSSDSSLGDINSLLAQYNQGPDLSSIYQGAGGY